MKVLLDNGHGRDTAGKRSPLWPDGTQLFEWEFNRDITGRVKNVLAGRGIDCELIVPEDYDVPLAERVQRANTISEQEGKDNCLLVSVHANAGGGSGWEAWTSPGHTLSDNYAEIFYWAAQEVISPLFPIRSDLSDGDMDKEHPFYILRRTLCPAVLTENLFMDNPKDCRFLLSEEGRQAIVRLHVLAVERSITFRNGIKV